MLELIEELPDYKPYRSKFALYRCHCGNTKIANMYSVKYGTCRSCGCALQERKNHLTHGHSVDRKHSPAYESWNCMMKRCKTHKNYAGRGIKVCERWKKFENFLADMGECEKGYSIDRINNDGNYEPSNCRWITRSENCKKGNKPCQS